MPRVAAEGYQGAGASVALQGIPWGAVEVAVVVAASLLMPAQRHCPLSLVRMATLFVVPVANGGAVQMAVLCPVWMAILSLVRMSTPLLGGQPRERTTNRKTAGANRLGQVLDVD